MTRAPDGRMTRRALAAAPVLATPLLAAPSIARAQTALRWRMVTSWPRHLVGPGISAQQLVDRINAAAGGRLTIQLFSAGEIVPAFAAFDAVANGVVEMAHTASFFTQGKLPAAFVFTTAPFGLSPLEHQGWIEAGDGQALWDELYRPFGVRALLAGNTGPSLGGWFRRDIKALADIKGLRIRVQGIGGEVYRRLGATPLAIPPGELEVALERGAIDAAELLAPANDISVGLYRHARALHAPGFNKPNGAAEALFGIKAWDSLPGDLQAIMAGACAAEHAAGLAQAEHDNAAALSELLGRHGVQLVTFPIDVIAAARAAAADVIGEIALRDAVSGRIVASYRAALERGRGWAALQAYMQRAMRV